MVCVSPEILLPRVHQIVYKWGTQLPASKFTIERKTGPVMTKEETNFPYGQRGEWGAHLKCGCFDEYNQKKESQLTVGS